MRIPEIWTKVVASARERQQKKGLLHISMFKEDHKSKQRVNPKVNPEWTQSKPQLDTNFQKVDPE